MHRRLVGLLNAMSLAALAVLCVVSPADARLATIESRAASLGTPNTSVNSASGLFASADAALTVLLPGADLPPLDPRTAEFAVASPAAAAAASLMQVADDDSTDDGDATESETEEAKSADDEEHVGIRGDDLTLERLFPEESLWGPGAQNTSFSHDGRYGAFLYRPRIERRHGNDLWLYDTETGEMERVTMASVMSEYQASARKVRDDRREKAEKRGDGQKDTGEDASGESARTDDGVSGTWEGRLQIIPDDEGGPGQMTAFSARQDNDDDDSESGAGRMGMLPPQGMTFRLELKVDPSDNSVSGTLSTAVISASIREGRWRADDSMLELTLADVGSDLTGELEAEVVEADRMEGIITVPSLDLEFTIDADRTERLVDQVDQQGDSTTTDEDDAENGDSDGDADTDDDADGDDSEGTGDTEDSDEEEEQKQHDDRDLGDIVDEDDADDRRAPRYSGITTYVWSPTKNEMIFTSEGDLYQFDVDSRELTRLTRTRETERDVQYLPDGSGYTYLRDNELLCVRFGSHLMEQLDPRLEGGERMTGYRISPDGTRLVFLAARGESYWARGRRVNIVDYRDRFARVRQVVRHMPDDPYTDFEWSVYLYDLREHQIEKHEPKKVYTHKQTGPRDIMQVPEWSPDSSKIAFSVFRQDNGTIEILEAGFVPKESDEDGQQGANNHAEPSGDDATADGDSDHDIEHDEEHADGHKGDASAEEEDEAPQIEYTIEEAGIIYKFFHNGGPNTPRMIQPVYLSDSHRLAFLTELSGFRHLHVLDPTYEQLDQVTRGRYEVYPFQVSRDHRYIFATTTNGDPAQERIFKIDLETGEEHRLCVRDGFHSTAAVSDDGRHVLANHIDFGSLRELRAIDTEAAEEEVLTDSHPEELHLLTKPAPEYFSFLNRHGHEIHGHMFKPDDWTPDDKRPLLIYVYGGPLGTRKMVSRGAFSGDSYFFGYYMAKKHGYVTCTIDPRGASGYGGLFEKSNYEQVGKPQVEDLVDGARWMIENQGVDPDRVGIHGWSFGGFQTQMCLYTEPDVFAAGIAGAGPTEWENYNSWYSTGTIGASRTGQTDLAEFSLLPLAKNLEAKLLLVHGMEDANVLYQDTVRVYRELLRAGKETLVELFLDPTGGHGLGGDVKSLNRFRKYEEFLLRVLGTGHPAEADEDSTETESEDTVEGEDDDEADPRSDA
ncbi:MAG: prolyl oligopeptidase family serine peptidase [Planctomycetota bacterium]